MDLGFRYNCGEITRAEINMEWTDLMEFIHSSFWETKRKCFNLHDSVNIYVNNLTVVLYARLITELGSEVSFFSLNDSS